MHRTALSLCQRNRRYRFWLWRIWKNANFSSVPRTLRYHCTCSNVLDRRYSVEKVFVLIKENIWHYW